MIVGQKKTRVYKKKKNHHNQWFRVTPDRLYSDRSADSLCIFWVLFGSSRTFLLLQYIIIIYYYSMRLAHKRLENVGFFRQRKEVTIFRVPSETYESMHFRQRWQNELLITSVKRKPMKKPHILCHAIVLKRIVF